MAYVLKIKYENSLRRLTLQTNEFHEDRSFAKMETRIRNLFQLPETARLVVTYIDTENDVVTMANDQDVVDALVQQSLNPLRVFVSLVDAKSNPAPIASEVEKSAAVPDANVPLNKLFSRSMKNLVKTYEPLLEEVSSPAQAPGVMETLVRSFSNAVKHGADAASGKTSGSGVSPSTKASGSPSASPVTVQVSSALADLIKHGSSALTGKPSGGGASSFDLPRAADISKAVAAFETLVNAKSVPATDTSSRSSDAFNAAAEAAVGKGETSSRSSDAFNAAAASAVSKVETSSRSSNAFNAAISAAGEVETKKEVAGPEVVVHHNVSCDLCGVNPITGLRWKSNKMYDYDLCSNCFAKHGKESEYTKIDQSMFRARHHYGPLKMGPLGPPFHPMGGSGFHGGKSFGGRGPAPGSRHHCGPMMGPGYGGGKLDARFVCDVTMFDGTEIAPGTRFTKVWRLRNSGSIPWPARTNLVHVGGDELGQIAVVPLEIAAQGLVPQGEMEVSVELVAPVKPGRYVSHWRLASPHGPKFGHRIWVVIQVVSNPTVDEPTKVMAASDDTSVQTTETVVDAVSQEAEAATAKGEVTRELEPTMSFVDVEELVAGIEGSVGGVAEVEVSKSEDKELEHYSSAAESALGEGFSMVGVSSGDLKSSVFLDGLIPIAAVERASVDVSTPSVEYVHEQETVRADEETKSVTTEESPPVEETPVSEIPIGYPVLDVTRDQGRVAYPVIPEVTYAAVVNESAAVSADLSTPKALLGKLEAMGFMDSKLNLELLEKNNMDLRKTLDDLCALEDWDPILEELQEMGFNDADTNRRLMFKNNGSVKRVVKELVQMYRDV